MASGLDGSFGVKNETTWGTRVAPTHFPRVRTCSITAEDVWVQGEGIQSGQQFPYQNHLVRTDTNPKFEVAFDYQTRDILPLFKGLFGAPTTAQQGATAAYKHTFSGLGTWTDMACTVQVANPRQGSTTVDCIELSGAKVTDMEVSCGVGELVNVMFSGAGKTYDTGQTLASPSYNSSEVAPFTQATVKWGTYSSETTLDGARAYNLRLSRTANVDDNSTFGGTKTEPEPNGFPTLEGTLEVDYNATALTTDWRAGTSRSLVFEWVGSLIASTYYQTFRITVPSVKLQGPGPNPDGPGLERVTWDWKGGYDGTNAAIIVEIINAETGVTGF